MNAILKIKNSFCLLLLFLLISKQQRAITLTVGASKTYATIAAAYAAATTAASYTIEVYSDYANTEAKPITLAGGIGFTSMVIRPATGASAISITTVTGTEACIFDFTGGDNITIDGRIGSTGSTVLWTITNAQTAASKYAIRFSGGSTGNTITYCNVLGSNSTVASAATTAGVILLSSGTNSNNTFDYCTIKDASGGKPAVGINSYDATNNNQTTVSNCNIANFTAYGLMISTSQTAWTITGNSFYADYSITGAQAIYMIHITTGTGYTITGNYFGGQAAGCTVGNYTLSSAYQFYPIHFASCTAGTITINGNYFQKIAFTCTYAGLQFAPINVAAGAASINFGITSSHNTIGATTGTANITITDNVNSASVVQCFLGKFLNTGTNTISYNDVGAITINGSNTNAGKTTYAVYMDLGTETFSNNTIGNTTANNIILSPTTGAITYLIYPVGTCVGTVTVNNNTVQNVQNNAATGAFAVLYSLDLLSADGNTFSGISSASSYATSPYQGIIIHYVTDNTSITNNVIKGITFSHASSKANAIYITTGTGAATITCTGNTIGQFGVANDITFAGNTATQCGIYISDGGDIVCNSNIIQNVSFTSASSASRGYGINSADACDGVNTFNNNGIDNLTTASTYGSQAEVLTGIYVAGDGGNTLSGNTITDLTVTGSADGQLVGIYFDSPGAASITNLVEKNRITGLSSSVAGTDLNSYIAAMRLKHVASSTYNIYNNVWIIDNGSYTTRVTHVLHANTTAASTINVYYNTFKVAGASTMSSAGDVNDCFWTASTSGTITMKNNILQNVTTGGTGKHYAIRKTAAGPTWTETNNYLQGTDYIGDWQGTAYSTLANWQTNSGAGTNDKTGSITIASSGVVSGATTSDVKQTGTPYGSVTTDYDGTSRDGTTPYMGAYENTVALPVGLLEFTATPTGRVVELRWITLTEINNDFFTIERSVNAIDFTPVAIVKGAGNSQGTIHYKDTDIQPLQGLSYYRLKQTDFDGTESYSQIVAVNFVKEGELHLYPNPSGNNITLSFVSSNALPYTLEIYDNKGSLVKTANYVSTEEGMNSLSLDLSELTTGHYLIRLSNSEEALKTTIIKE